MTLEVVGHVHVIRKRTFFERIWRAKQLALRSKIGSSGGTSRRARLLPVVKVATA